MNGRDLTPSTSERNLTYNNIRYVKPVSFLNEEQQQTRNLYYDSNPYFMNGGLTPSRSRGIYNTSRNGLGTIFKNRDLSEASSKNSKDNSTSVHKLVRANGLRIAEKPRFMKESRDKSRNSGYSERQSSHHSNYSTTVQTKGGMHSLNQSKKIIDRNIFLEEQNRKLQLENQNLKQKLTEVSQVHKKEIQALEGRFLHLLKMSEDLEKQYSEDEIQWKKKMHEISSDCFESENRATTSTKSAVSSALGGLVSNQPQQYHNYSSSLQPQDSNISAETSSQISTRGNYLIKR